MAQLASLQKKAAHASHTFTLVRTPVLAFSSVSTYPSPLSSRQAAFTQSSTLYSNVNCSQCLPCFYPGKWSTFAGHTGRLIKTTEESTVLFSNWWTFSRFSHCLPNVQIPHDSTFVHSCLCPRNLMSLFQQVVFHNLWYTISILLFSSISWKLFTFPLHELCLSKAHFLGIPSRL